MNKKLFSFIILYLLNSGRDIPVSAQVSTFPVQGNYAALSCPEAIYIHTDRDLYVAGENMLFKIYVVPLNSLKSRRVSSLAYMVLRDSKMNILNLIIKMTSGSSFGSIYIPDTLKSGMYELVAFTNYMKNYGENIFFRKELIIVNRFDKMLTNFYSHDSLPFDQKLKPKKTLAANNAPPEIIQFIIDKDSFKTREKLRIGISWNNKSSKLAFIQASVSVKPISAITTIPIESISLGLDTLEYKSETVNYPKLNYYFAEEKGLYIEGRITTINNTPLKNECLLISAFDSAANLQYTFSNDSGRFQFLLDNYYLGKKLALKSWENESHNPDYKIEIEDKFMLHFNYIPNMPGMSINLKKYIYNSQEIIQIRKSYGVSENILYDSISKNTNDIFPYVYSQPGTIIYPGDFVALDNFKEITDNILGGCTLRKSKDVYKAYLFDKLSRTLFSKPALMFIDGLVIDNASQILSLNSNDILKIELCNNLRIKGLMEFPGLVSITTKKQTPDYARYNSSGLIFKIDKYTNKAYFRPLIYDKTASLSRMPDFRQLLYWNPEFNLKIGETNYIEFSSSDYTSEYLVELRGFTSDGTPVSAYTKFKVYR